MFFWDLPANVETLVWIIRSVWVGPYFAVGWPGCRVMSISLLGAQEG